MSEQEQPFVSGWCAPPDMLSLQAWAEATRKAAADKYWAENPGFILDDGPIWCQRADCPHCLAARVIHCHECLNNIERDAAPAAGWRMDHLSGFGCIALCPAHR